MPDLKRCDFRKHRRDRGSFFLVSLSILSFLMGSVFASGSLQAGVILPGQYRLLDPLRSSHGRFGNYAEHRTRWGECCADLGWRKYGHPSRQLVE